MKRIVISSVLVIAAVALAGCVGDTDPATNVTFHTAQLHAHGRTDDGPAYWWWEYSTDRDFLKAGGGFRVCGSGSRCGPASSSSTVNLGTTVYGLQFGTTYYFRACGQDVPNPPSENEPPVCGRILSFTTGGSYAFDRKWGAYGTANGQFKSPSGVATDAAGNVYVADTGNHRIQKFGPTGNFLAKWGSLGSGDGQLNSPKGVAIDAAGNVYVADTGNDRIQKFSSSGAFIAKWGSSGTGDGQFNSPKGLATYPTADVYVADSGNDRIQKFSSTGAFIAKWGSSGTGNGQFNAPAGVVADSNFVAVADRGNHRMQAFYAPNANFLTTWGTLGANDGQFNNPSGIAMDRYEDNIGYVADTGNNRIQKFDFTAFVTKWGSLGTGDGQFKGPQAVASDRLDNVYVADTGNHRIQKFKVVQ